ncbi:hypothetical protein ACIBO5_52250 [Nonomuraea angiospora]|uniref:hypothetical protein n=1 Tax=Nonomuraea angiospora TaxID=46172 RepID=UPI0037B0E638
MTAHGIARDKIFSEKISTRLRVRPRSRRPWPPPGRSRPMPRTAASSSPCTRYRQGCGLAGRRGVRQGAAGGPRSRRTAGAPTGGADRAAGPRT